MNNKSPLISVSGTVVDGNGKPMDGIEIHLRDSPSWRATEHSQLNPDIGFREAGTQDYVFATTKTDTTGAYRFDEIEAPPYKTKQRADWSVVIPQTQHTAIAARKLAGPNHEAPMRFQLVPTQSVAGQVVDATGKPVVGIEIYTIAIYELDQKTDEDFQIWDSKISPKATTDEQGRFELNGLPENKRIMIGSVPYQGFFPISQYIATTDIPQPDVRARNIRGPQSVLTDNIVLVARKGNRISGRVTFPDGSPAQNRKGSVVLKSTNVPIRFQTDKDGHFETNSLFLDRKVHVTIQPPKGTNHIRSIKEVTFENDGEVKNVDIVFEQGTQVSGVLTTKDGDPIAGAIMFLLPTDQPMLERRVDSFTATTNDQGEFEICAAPNVQATLFATKRSGELTGYKLADLERVFSSGYYLEDQGTLAHMRREVRFQPSKNLETGTVGNPLPPIKMTAGD